MDVIASKECVAAFGARGVQLPIAGAIFLLVNVRVEPSHYKDEFVLSVRLDSKSDVLAEQELDSAVRSFLLAEAQLYAASGIGQKPTIKVRVLCRALVQH